MPLSNRSGKGGRVLHILLIAALVVVSRAPFLVRGDRFFDSDEAVEGLMARHVLQGEHPVFLWGQRYKGVPEVYLTAALFAVTGPSVVALKSVTLGCFAVFVALQFLLVERLFSRVVAWMATVFLIVGPPSLVLWSLSASAEIVLTLLAGTLVCLGFDIWRRTGSRPALAVACASLGFGVWVQQFIIYYVVALGLAVLYDMPKRRQLIGDFLAARDLPAWGRTMLWGVAAVAVGYVALGAAAFLTGGFDLAAAGLRIGVHHPQKLWHIAAAVFFLCGGARVVSLLASPPWRAVRPTVLLAASAFALGYLPALVGYAMGGGGAPIARADLRNVSNALLPILRQVVPIVFGFRSPTTGWLGVPPWLGLMIGLAIGASFFALRRRTFTPLFHLLLVTATLLFLLSGAFVNAQSYRYLMPVAGALSVVMALGVSCIFRQSRVAGAVSLATLLVLFALEQRAWYLELMPDAQSAAIIACLDRAGVRAAYADYWLSYKLTFLTGERIIVAPNSGVDRYLPYRDHVRAQPSAPTIPQTISTSCAQPSRALF